MGLTAESSKEISNKFFIEQAYLVKITDYWPHFFMDLSYISAYQHSEKELGQYPAILTSIAHIYGL